MSPLGYGGAPEQASSFGRGGPIYFAEAIHVGKVYNHISDFAPGIGHPTTTPDEFASSFAEKFLLPWMASLRPKISSADRVNEPVLRKAMSSLDRFDGCPEKWWVAVQRRFDGGDLVSSIPWLDDFIRLDIVEMRKVAEERRFLLPEDNHAAMSWAVAGSQFLAGYVSPDQEVQLNHLRVTSVDCDGIKAAAAGSFVPSHMNARSVPGFVLLFLACKQIVSKPIVTEKELLKAFVPYVSFACGSLPESKIISWKEAILSIVCRCPVFGPDGVRPNTFSRFLVQLSYSSAFFMKHFTFRPAIQTGLQWAKDFTTLSLLFYDVIPSEMMFNAFVDFSMSEYSSSPVEGAVLNCLNYESGQLNISCSRLAVLDVTEMVKSDNNKHTKNSIFTRNARFSSAGSFATVLILLFLMLMMFG